jgi:hypothetical protein
VVTIGERVWRREGSDPYREATIDLSLADGSTGELVDLERAAKVGRHIGEVGPDRYELTAPSSAFNGPEGGHRLIRLVVTLTAGHLHRLRRIEEQGGIGFVAAPGKHITGRDEFSELFGPDPLDEE